MSGIYIPGMGMPENCHDCRFCGWSNFWQAYDCHMTNNKALLLFNREKTNSDSRTRNGRADNCPLVPVPDHGKLGDLDALYDHMRKAHDKWRENPQEHMSINPFTDDETMVLYAPTIIPADPAKEG